MSGESVELVSHFYDYFQKNEKTDTLFDWAARFEVETSGISPRNNISHIRKYLRFVFQRISFYKCVVRFDAHRNWKEISGRHFGSFFEKYGKSIRKGDIGLNFVDFDQEGIFSHK
jgi:hypothetical protein